MRKHSNWNKPSLSSGSGLFWSWRVCVWSRCCMKTCRHPQRLYFLGSWRAHELSHRRVTAECAAAHCPLQRQQKKPTKKQKQTQIGGTLQNGHLMKLVKKQPCRIAMWSRAPIPVASLISSKVNSSPSLNISSTSVWKSDTCSSFLPCCRGIKHKIRDINSCFMPG